MSDENEGIVASLLKTIENNWRLLLVGIIIIAIAITSSGSDSTSSEESKNSPTPTPQTEQSKAPEENKPEEQSQKPEVKTEIAATTPAPTKEPEAVRSDTNTNVQIAAKSEGITHLARRAIKEYLGSTGENLSAEQKIYAEDYLKKKTGAKKLAVGEEVKFSTELIKQGVEKAKGLSENQIKNLSKYVPLVKNLN